MQRRIAHKQQAVWQTSHRGFTLTELLVATGIMLILLTITVAVYSSTASADRIRSSARQVQSSVNGARDRAMKAAKNNPLERRGLRFLVDANDASLVTSMVYVGNDGPWTDGGILLARLDTTPQDWQADSPSITVLKGFGTSWQLLYSQGLLVNGARIKIPASSAGTWYTVSITSPVVNETLYLSSGFSGGTGGVAFGTTPDNGPDLQPGRQGVDDDGNGMKDDTGEFGWIGSDDITDVYPFGQTGLFDYILELKPTVLPGQEPMRLSNGIAIDLDNSKIPAGWYRQTSLPKGSPLPPQDIYGTWVNSGGDASNPANDIYREYSPWMDVMFAPQGSITGPASVTGTIVLRLAETDDILLSRNPADPQSGVMLYSTLFTQSGYVATFPVDITDTSPNDGFADDPLYFVRRGGTAGK